MADAFKALLGETLVGTEKGIEAFCGEGKTVGLYFSAHWCPPCRGFTPKLAEFYKKLHAEKNFEIVFVSSDKNEEEFQEYYKEMPWLALPFSDRDRKKKLSKKFKVKEIPTLILLDGKDRKVITKDARIKVLEDPAGEAFPWKPKGINDLLKGVKLVNNAKEEKHFEDLAGKVVGFYFSAHWCPPCRGFTPKLIKTYNKLKTQGKPFEVIFVSSDRTDDSFSEYLKDMPWLAVPYGEVTMRTNTLTSHFGVKGIPTLIIVDENYKVLTSNGRGLVAKDPEAENFPWNPRPLNVLEDMNITTVNDDACLFYFTDGEDASIKGAQEIIEPVAEHFFKMEEPPVLFFYTKGDEVSDSLREFAGLPDDDNLLVILDVPSQMYYILEEDVLTREAIEKFVTDFANSKLEGNRIKG